MVYVHYAYKKHLCEHPFWNENGRTEKCTSWRSKRGQCHVPVCLGRPWKEHQALRCNQCCNLITPLYPSSSHRAEAQETFLERNLSLRPLAVGWTLDKKIDNKETIRKRGKRLQFWPKGGWAPSLCQCPGILVKCHGYDSRISYGLRCTTVVPQLCKMSGSTGP